MAAKVLGRDARSWIRLLLRAGVVVGVMAALSALPYQLVGDTGDGKLGRMRQELRRARVEMAQIGTELEGRRRQVEALKNDPQSIEAIARTELQMLYPHEKTLRLREPARSPQAAAGVVK